MNLTAASSDAYDTVVNLYGGGDNDTLSLSIDTFGEVPGAVTGNTVTMDGGAGDDTLILSILGDLGGTSDADNSVNPHRRWRVGYLRGRLLGRRFGRRPGLFNAHYFV